MEHVDPHDGVGDIIDLHIDRYEDIFSDFDARPLAERSLSEDFIEELKRQLYARDESIDGIFFQMPGSKRNADDEAAIRERLVSYFRKRAHQKQEARHAVVLRSSLMIAGGTVGMFIATYLTSFELSHRFPISFFRVLLEPASWFLIWEGLNQRFFRASEITPEVDLYMKISKAHTDIRFVSE